MNELAAFLISLISIVFILFLLLWRYRDYRTDAFRQIMFQLRDELFDEARKGMINFDDDAYVMLRSAINGFIRFGHKLNLMQVMLLHITLKENYVSESFSERLKKNCTDEQKEIIISYYTRMNDHIIEHLILSSYILLLIMSITFMLVIPILPLLAAKKQIEKLANYFISLIDKLDLEKIENMPA